MTDTTATPADPPGVVRSLSPSRASDFMTCPLLYRFRVVDRIPEAPSPEAVRGTLVHAVLERLYDLPAERRSPDAARALLPEAWEALLAEEPELAAVHDDDWWRAAEDLLDAYFRLEDPARLEPAERELEVRAELESGLVLRGFVDRLDVAPTGEVRVVDYKTGRAPRDGFEQKALFQMRFYALTLWRSRGVVPRLLQLLYLGSQEVLRYQPDEADLRATERKVEALRAAIDRAAYARDWRPNPSRLCDWCDHQQRCPAFGGTPPPLPEPGDVTAEAESVGGAGVADEVPSDILG